MAERVFYLFFRIIPYFLLGILILMFFSLFWNFIPALRKFGLSSFLSLHWEPNRESFGIFPALFGTFLVTFLSLIFSFPFVVAVSLFLGEFRTKGKLSIFLQSLLDIIAGIPSVIIGFFGIIFVGPLIKEILDFFVKTFPVLKSVSLLGLESYSGYSVFMASVIMSFMITPFAASIGKEAFLNVSREMKEAGYSLGANRFELIRYVMVPSAMSSLFSGFLLSSGRAIGETMAVTMLIGNKNIIPSGLFSSGQTVSSLIANEFAEATDVYYTSSIIGIGFILFFITMFFNFIGRYLIRKSRHHS